MDLLKAVEYCLKAETSVEGTQVKLGTVPVGSGGDRKSVTAREALAMRHE